MIGVRARRAAAMVRLPVWISLRRTRPVSDHWGFDRGTPVDRYYFDEFLEEHRQDIRGDVLEVKSSDYTKRFGSAVTAEHVLDIDPDSPGVTVVADLNEPGSLPAGAYDCFLLMQTLQLIRYPEVALATAWSALRPGGTLLLTVPTASRVERVLRGLLALHRRRRRGAARAELPGRARRRAELRERARLHGVPARAGGAGAANGPAARPRPELPARRLRARREARLGPPHLLAAASSLVPREPREAARRGSHQRQLRARSAGRHAASRAGATPPRRLGASPRPGPESTRPRTAAPRSSRPDVPAGPARERAPRARRDPHASAGTRGRGRSSRRPAPARAGPRSRRRRLLARTGGR